MRNDEQLKVSDPRYFIETLGFFGFLAATFTSLSLAEKPAELLTIVLLFGPHAYFVDGLRLPDWKHQVLCSKDI